MDTAAVVFLFDGDAPELPCWYGGVFDSAFLAALSSADPAGFTNSSLFRGDALVHNLATKVTGVSKSERQSTYRQSHDKDLLGTVIWDIADSLAGQWNTLDPDAFPLLLGRHSVHCISLPTIPRDLIADIDRSLRGSRGYLGAVEVDLGNPIQRFLFIDHLVKDAVISGGQVILELSWEGELNTLFNGAETFRPNGRRLVAQGALAALRPPVPAPSALSSRGELSLQRYSGKRNFSLQERVLSALFRADELKLGPTSFEFSVDDGPLRPSEADLPEAKFIRYLLDPKHPKGGSKAKFFNAALGIDQRDWRYLAAQLHDGLKHATLKDLGVKSWDGGIGVAFNAVIPVRGLNGRTIDIDSNWIMEPGMQPRLSTAVPAASADATGIDGTFPAVVDPGLVGNERWQAIHELASQAGRIAAEATIPTPMLIDGFGIEPEGRCGHAWVRVKDARRGFARWALANDHAYRHHRSGAQVFAATSSQSVDRGVAYALAYARVLKHNGISCEIESHLT